MASELREKLNNIVEDYNACEVLAKSMGSSDAYAGTTATAEDIRVGKTAYSNGIKLEGTLEISDSSKIEGSISSASNFRLLVKEIDGDVVITATDAKEFFYNYQNLVSIKSLNTSNVKQLFGMFYNCYNLVDVPVMDWTNVKNYGTAETALKDVFYSCNKLSDESLNNIMASCISAKDYIGTNSLALLGIYNVEDRCKKLSNYQAFIDAGWKIS